MKLGNKKSILGIAAFVAGTMGLLSPALAERPDDGLYDLYTSSFEDKVVAFVPIGMYDLTQGWIAALEHSAERLGYDFQVVKVEKGGLFFSSECINSVIDHMLMRQRHRCSLW